MDIFIYIDIFLSKKWLGEKKKRYEERGIVLEEWTKEKWQNDEDN